MYRLFLLTAAFFWGCAFVAQRMSTGAIGAFGFNGMRFLLGALCVMPVIIWLSKKHDGPKETKPCAIPLIGACAICGFILYSGAALQQLGIFYTTAGKAGFITALYIVVVPIIGTFLKKPLCISHVIGCLTAVVGLYFLAYHSDNSFINLGDLLCLVGVTFWSLHILVIDRFVQSYSGLSLAVGQFLFCALFNFLTMPFVGEELTVTQLVDSAIPILYCGIFSSGIGFTFQIIGQKNVPATEASLLMSFEMIFGALSGFLILGEMMTTREFMGCILMTVGIFAAQIPSRQILRLS